MMNQGQKLKMLREALGLSQDKFSIPLAVTKVTISNLERDIYPIHKKVLDKIHEYYGVNPYFFDDEYTPTSNGMSVEEMRAVVGGEEKKIIEKYVATNNKHIEETNLLLSMLESQQRTIEIQQKMVEIQQRTIENQQKTIDTLTEKLLVGKE